MRIHWLSAIVLSSALAAGCGGTNNQNDQAENAQGQPPAATAPADQGQVNPPTTPPGADTSTPSAAAARPATPPRTRASRSNTAGNAAAAPAEPSATSAAESATPAPAPAPRDEFREVTVPAGTALPLALLTPLSSATAAVETPVRARVRQDIVVDGATAIPAGSVLTGTVTDAAAAGRVRGKAHLAFRFNDIEVRGTRERVSTNPLTYEAEATRGEDATKIGAGAGIGAAIGGLLGGGKGAAKGAAIGGAAGTGVVLSTKGKEVNLAEGTNLAPTLADALTINVPVR
jgi:hypothetical protein